jgi:hypothetical protein
MVYGRQAILLALFRTHWLNLTGQRFREKKVTGIFYSFLRDEFFNKKP